MSTLILKIKRGTNAQWVSSTKILQVGELGFDTTVSKFKIGDGSTSWINLPYLNVLPSELNEMAQDAIGLALKAGNGIVKTYNDGLNTITLDADLDVLADKVYVDDAITALGNTSDTTYVLVADVAQPDGVASLDSSGVIPNSQIPTQMEAKRIVGSSYASSKVDLTGFPVLLEAGLYGVVIRSSSDMINFKQWEFRGDGSSLIPGNLIFEGATDNDYETTLAITDPTEDRTIIIPNSSGTVALTSDITNAISVKAPIDNPTFTGVANVNDLTIGGQLTFNGTATQINSTSLTVADPLIYIGEGNTSNTVDLGFVSSLNDGTYQHAGFVRDATDGVWKLFKGVTDEPTSTINFAQATYDAIKVGSVDTVNLNATGTITGIDKADIGLSNVDNTSDETKFKNDYLSSSATALTLNSTTHKFKVIEFSSSSPIAVTIPNDTQDSGWPIGSSVEIRQIGTGQITVGKDAAVTYNAPESQYKTRVQWSSLFIEKRAANTWLITGDATA